MDRCANTEALNKYLQAQDEAEERALSNCCDAEFYEDSDICTKCDKNAVTNAEANEMAMYDNADAKMEEARENR